MPVKQIISGEEARKKVLAGVTKLYTQVSATLGPKGRNILIEDVRGKPLVTKDGVTVADEIELEDPFENQGALLVKGAARKTNDKAGDGTTTATILAHAMMESGMAHIGKGANPILIKRGMDRFVSLVTEELKKISVAVKEKEDYEAVATISSQDPEIGKMISEVIDEIGDDGIITIEAGQGMGLEKRFVEGMQFDSGYRSQYFANNAAADTVILENCAVLITDARITDIQQILPILEGLAQKSMKEILIIAEDIEGEALSILVLNKLKNVVRCVAVRAPSFGEKKKELLKDIAAVTAAQIASQETGLPIEKARLEHLGFAKKVTVTQTTTTITEGKGTKEEVTTRVDEVKAELEATTSEYEQEQINKRLARMTGGIAVISVGGATEVEQVERQHRVEDALSATKAAAAEGILPGGGTALIRAAALVLSQTKTTGIDEAAGFTIVADAIEMPLYVIAENAGADAKAVLKEVKKLALNVGYNALTGEYEDLVKARIIDPTLVTRSALENAASVASMFLTLEGVIVKKPLDTQEKALAAMMGPAAQLGQ